MNDWQPNGKLKTAPYWRDEEKDALRNDSQHSPIGLKKQAYFCEKQMVEKLPRQHNTSRHKRAPESLVYEQSTLTTTRPGDHQILSTRRSTTSVLRDYRDFYPDLITHFGKLSLLTAAPS
ncbi:unnamed protein product [Protopolystoma xenopodis]|uniref:Uncharacterized protein n=1 Tax=Protopolystoma xenopodis TaxID=117903 RepID=A0A3S5FC26_9PLAT|nr:unnamed protein product [Protopolystoma xenopodis]